MSPTNRKDTDVFSIITIRVGISEPTTIVSLETSDATRANLAASGSDIKSKAVRLIGMQGLHSTGPC